MYNDSTKVKSIAIIADTLSVILVLISLKSLFRFEFLLDIKLIGLASFLTFVLALFSTYLYSIEENFQVWFSSCIQFSIKEYLIIIFVTFCSKYFYPGTISKIGMRYLFFSVFFTFFSILISRLVAQSIIRFLVKETKNVIVVTEFRENDGLLSELKKQSYNILAYYTTSPVANLSVPTINNDKELQNIIAHNKVDEIFITEDAAKIFYEKKEYFQAMGIPTSLSLGRLKQSTFSSATISNVGQTFTLKTSMKHATYQELVVKRLIDIVAAIVGLFITAVVTLFVAPIIKKQSPGPLLFKQKRVGKNGKVFEMYKFRSMYLDAEERKKELMALNEVNSEHMFKLENDPRIFPFGHIIRKFSIDELPQFINVLKGDMSLVGTRPPTLDEYHKYKLHHFKRLAVKPGITGMWQVSGRSNIKDFEKVVQLDSEYIEKWSIWLDFKIILKTFVVILRKEGSK